MSMDTIEGEVYEPGTAVATRASAQVATWTPRFVVSVDDAVRMVNEKRDFMNRVMRRGMHYGTIPGTDKPALWKPGAELLLSSMGLQPELSNESEPVLDLNGDDHGGETFIFYQRVCRIYRLHPQTGERFIVAQAGGSCSSWETKYRYRDAKPACPACGKDLRVSKKDDEWYCWRKQGGCGKTFPLDQFQNLGKVPNPEVAELLNTVLKMADKRALVAATLLATGCSDIFTQDQEMVTNEPPPDWTPPPEKAKPAPAATAHVGRTLAQERAYRAWLALHDRVDTPQADVAFREWARGKTPTQVVAEIDAERAAKAPPAAVAPPSAPRDDDSLLTPDDAVHRALMAAHGTWQHSDTERHRMYHARFGVDSAKQLTRGQAKLLIRELETK